MGKEVFFAGKYSKDEFVTEIAKKLISSLMNDFRDETKAAISYFVNDDKVEPDQTGSNIDEVFNDVLMDFIQLEKASVDEICTVAVKFHDIKTDRKTIKSIMEMVSLPLISMVEEQGGVYVLNPDFHSFYSLL